MSGGTISNSATKIEAIKLQSSAYGVTIPWVMGMTRIPGNLLWYGGFQSHAHTETEGGKGGVKVQSTSFTYTASVVMALGHGPMIGTPRIWRGKKLYNGDATPGLIKTEVETYAVPASGPMAYTVAEAASWFACLHVMYPVYADSEGGPVYAGDAPMAQDLQYTARDGVITVLDESMRGLTVTITYQWYDGSIVHNALTDLSLSFLPGEIGQAVWSGLASAPSAEQLGYSGLCCVAGEDYALGTGAEVENHNFEVIAAGAYSIDPTVPDVDPTVCARDLLGNARYGAGFPAQAIESWDSWSDFCVASGILMSPAITEQVKASEALRMMAELTNAAPVWSAGRLRMVPFADAAVSGYGRTFTPDITPVYDLDDECFTPPPGEPPVQVTMKTPADRFNHVRVEYLNRANEYAVEIAEAKDQADIDVHGLRTKPTIKAHWVCDLRAAGHIAQLILQRSLAVTSEYAIQLPAHFAMLEPADLVTLTETTSQYSMYRLPARITSIEESENGDLSVRAEHCPLGMANAPIYDLQSGDGYSANYNTVPADVQAPLIFEAPWELAGSTGIAVWIAVTGQAADQHWGGCNIWVSGDNSNYRRIGQVIGGARYGTLRSAVSSSDATVEVELVGRGGQILSGSAADADADNTLIYVEAGSSGEYLSHTTATLVAADQYDLDVQRGRMDTAGASADAGAGWAKVDSTIWRSEPLAKALVGTTYYVKFTSFNVYGLGEQNLADVDPYTYTVRGNMLAFKPGGGTLHLQTDRFPYFAFADGTTHTSTSDDLIITAVLNGLEGTPLFTAEAFDALGDSLGQFTLTGTGVQRTLTAALFVSLGTAGSVRHLDVTAKLGGSMDFVRVYRQDPTITEPRLYLSNPRHDVSTDADGDNGDYTGAETDAEVFVGITAVTDDFTFTIVPDAGLTATINGGAGPVSGTGAITVAVSDSTVGNGVVRIEASDGVDDLAADFRVVKVRAGATSNYQHYLEPLQSITLPVDQAGNVTSYAAAWTNAVVLKGTTNDTSAWTITKTDRNVTSTLVGGKISITSMLEPGTFSSTTNIGPVAKPTGYTGLDGWGNGARLLYDGAADAYVRTAFVINNAGNGYHHVQRSADGGATWVNVDLGAAGLGASWYQGTAMDGRMLLLATAMPGGAASDRALVSTDGGDTWSAQTMPGAHAWYAASSGDVFVIARNGSTTAYRSPTGLTGSWTSVTMPTTSSYPYYIAPGRWAAVDGSGNIHTSADGCATWTNRTGVLDLAGNYVHQAHGFRGLIVVFFQNSTTRIAVSADNGATWVNVTAAAAYSQPKAVRTLRDVLYMVGNDGKLHWSADGLKWRHSGEVVSAIGGFYSDRLYGNYSGRDLQLDYLLMYGDTNYRQCMLAASADGIGSVTLHFAKGSETLPDLTLMVTKAGAASNVYVASANPAAVLFPATSDGVVTDYAPGVVTAAIAYNGAPDTAAWTWSWVASTGITPSSGSTNVATITAMASGTDTGYIDFTATKAGAPVQTGRIPVSKSKGSEPSGPRTGAAFASFSATDTYIGLRFTSDGRVQVKRGSGGSWVTVTQWALPLAASNGSSYWIRVDTTGHALDGASSATATWLAMTSDRDYILSDAATGTHYTSLEVAFATSSGGAGAVANVGSLKLIVP